MLPNHSEDLLQIRFEIDINAPITAVWAKLSSPEGMQEWFARDLIFEPRVGGRFRIQGESPEEGRYRFVGEVVRIEPPSDLAFTWRPDYVEDGDWSRLSSLVTFSLKVNDSGGTRVTLLHSGFSSLGPTEGKQAYESHIQGWESSKTLQSLKELVENH